MLCLGIAAYFDHIYVAASHLQKCSLLPFAGTDPRFVTLKAMYNMTFILISV